MAGERKQGTTVLVPGAWLDASSWREVLLPLAHEGYAVRAAQLPFQSYEGDVAALNLLLNHVEGPVLLAGHSYAGAVISAAGNHPKVEALAYIAAFTPEADEVFGSILGLHPAEVPMTIGPDADGFLWLDSDFAAKALGHDLHRGILHFLVAVQKPVHHKIFEGKLTDPAWKHKPSSYLVAADDRIVSPETQRELARRIGARTEEITGSHLLPLSQPEAVAQFLRTSGAALTQ